MAMSPMMTQYLTIKEQYKDAILMFRLGDFYEMFFEDAKTASRELDLTLTGRDCGTEKRAPMCGVPYHAADGYIGRLVAKGYKVVICEQMEDPASAKGIVKREVTRIVTPGTVTDTSQLDDSKNNFIAAVHFGSDFVSLCFADISTGEMFATKTAAEKDMQKVINELSVYSPSEIIFNTDITRYVKLLEYVEDRLRASYFIKDEAMFDRVTAVEALSSCRDKDVSEELDPVYISAGALINYINSNLITANFMVKSFSIYGETQHLKLDANTRRSLELTETMRDRTKKGTLLWVLDKTKTSPGSRMLRRCIEMPLVNGRAILYRQSAVSELTEDFILREELGDVLKNVLDLERLMPKITYKTAGGRDLRAIYDTLMCVPKIKELVASSRAQALVDIRDKTDPISDVTSLIERSICEKPPFSVREGGFIADGYNEELDRLRNIKNNAKGYLDKIEESEREGTGIKSLKIGYNRVFGYYIEVTNLFKDKVPEHYIRKQTLANGERYITGELKQLEETIIGADEKINALEYSLFMDICEEVAREADRISRTATALAELDMYLSLANVAIENGYVCPEITLDDIIDIKDGRHPVVEKFVKDSYFVPNDLYLDTRDNRLMIITGPNMAGKSTFMRQTALICIMAQIGSFVPASDARIGIVDKIFTRVGASDDLAAGQSTFMLEMNEVAYILKNATKRSLILYDEIGRGTSTYDGMSIAKAVAEFTAGKRIGAKTMFATHYHEITSMANEVQGIVNFHVVAKKKGDDVVFLRKIVPGAADDSYGIEVAKLAGVPNEVIKRAREILTELEEQRGSISNAVARQEPEGLFNMSMDFSNDKIVRELEDVDINTLTPIEALNLIYKLKNML